MSAPDGQTLPAGSAAPSGAAPSGAAPAASAPSAATLGYDGGRAVELDALRDLVGSLPARIRATVEERAGSPAAAPRDRLLLLGIGASFAALATPVWQLRAAGIPAFRSDCSDLPGRPDGIADLAIAVSQSGRSRETTDVVSRLRDHGVPTLAITNTDENPLQSVSARGLRLGGFADSRVSTVGFVATYAALGMLVEQLTEGRVSDGWARLPELIPNVIADARAPLAAFAEAHLAAGGVDVIASAPQGTTAEAVALLFREGPLVAASAYGTRSYLHGPMDCAGHDVAHVVIGDERELQLARQLGQKTDAVLALTAIDGPVGDGHTLVRLPAGLSPVQRALVEVCLLQELVARTAEVRGEPVDDVPFTREDTKIDALNQLG